MRNPALTRCCQTLILVLLATAGADFAQGGVLHPSTWHLPWRKPPPAPPPIVIELPVTMLDGSAAPSVRQYWNRNTLRVDLTGMPAAGALRLAPSSVNGWPLRIEFAVRPGGMQQLEVIGDKRVVFTIASSGETQLLPLGDGAYTTDTGQLTLRWQ